MDHVTIERAFMYLDRLRDSSAVNMWGATPYLARFMGMPDRMGGPAAKLHTTWIASFDAVDSLDLEPRVAWAVGELAAD
jgi:hypothetical protein